jgi:hypothetical protein
MSWSKRIEMRGTAMRWTGSPKRENAGCSRVNQLERNKVPVKVRELLLNAAKEVEKRMSNA